MPYSTLPIPSPSTVNESSPSLPLGMEYETVVSGQVCRYRYVKFLDAVTYAAGQVCTWGNAACTSVTNDRSGGSSVSNRPAGIALAVMTQNYHGFVQTYGPYSAVVTNGDDDIAAGVPLIVASGTDGACDSATDPNPSLYFGDSTAADVDAANTVAAFIRIT